MKKMIVAADDFGFSEAYNYGAIKAYENGIVTTLSLMVNMDASRHAVNLRKIECPNAPLILHVNFVQNKPISKPEDIPSLVNEHGLFYRSYEWKSDNPNNKKCKGKVYPTADDFYIETKAQIIEFYKLTGVMPVHFDAHSTMTKPMQDAFIRIGKEMGIHNPVSQNQNNKMVQIFELSTKGNGLKSIADRGSDPEDWLNDNFGILKDHHNIIVIHFHPGYLDKYLLDNTSLTVPRCKDQATLCDPRVAKWICDNNIKLVSFQDIIQ